MLECQHIARGVMLVLSTMLHNTLLQLLELLQNPICVLPLPHIVDACHHNNLEPAGQVEVVPLEGPGEVPHPGTHNAFHLEVACHGRQVFLIPNAVQCAAAQNDPLGQVDWLEGGLHDVADGAHEHTGDRVANSKSSKVS